MDVHLSSSVHHIRFHPCVGMFESSFNSEEMASERLSTEADSDGRKLLQLPDFLSDGKRHVLPITVLAQLNKFVEKNMSSIIHQVKASSTKVFEPDVMPCGYVSDEQLSRRDHKERQVNIGGKAKARKKWKKRKHQNSSCSDSQNTEGSKDKEREKPGKKTRTCSSTSSEGKKRPNYFVSVQVSNPEIHSTAKQVHAHILEHSEADLTSAIEGVHKLHITLMVLRLENEEDIKNASKALDCCSESIKERTQGQPVTLDVEGLDVFNKGRVLFACVKATDGLEHLHFMAGEVTKHMQQVGLSSTDSRPFNPHLTLMKFQGKGISKLQKQGIKTVDEHLYQPFISKVFGSESVCSLQLCSMQKKREDGYYFVVHESSFASGENG